ncbi:MAG: tRNA lysidine(34) synthetase TilS, partial [Oscillospiraceae bacterium]
MSSKKKGLEEKLIAEPLYGKRVIVGFSGGADSVSLLYRLLEIREKKSLTLEAAHVNHCLRAEESERDEAFVRTFCDQWKIPLTVKRVNILKLAQEQHLSVEECGREQRYRFFAALAAEDGIVVTAHTLSDNMETVLFHIIRGTALTGLCGIPAERGNIVRPLLNCTRQDVEDYCKRKKLRFVTDSSNLSVAYTRNKIRLEILPKFYEINPAVDESFFRMLQTLQKDQDCLEQFAEDLWQRAEQGEQIALAQLSDQPEALLCRIGVKILKKYQLPLEHQYVQKVAALIKQGSGRQNIAENIHLKVKDGFLFLDLPVPKVPFFSYAID